MIELAEVYHAEYKSHLDSLKAPLTAALAAFADLERLSDTLTDAGADALVATWLAESKPLIVHDPATCSVCTRYQGRSGYRSG